MRERLQVLLLDEGLPFPLVEAAMGAPAATCRRWPPGRAFAALAGRDVFEDAVTAYNRCSALAAKGPTTPGRASVDPALLPTTPSASWPRLSRPRAASLLEALGHLELESAVEAAAAQRPAVDRYFDAVLVMDPDDAVRANRFAQLAAVTGLISRIGEFSRLPLTQA